MKKIILPILALFAAVPATAHAEDAATQRSSNRPAVKRRRSPEMLRYVCRVQGRLRGRCMIAAEWVP